MRTFFFQDSKYLQNSSLIQKINWLIIREKEVGGGGYSSLYGAYAIILLTNYGKKNSEIYARKKQWKCTACEAFRTVVMIPRGLDYKTRSLPNAGKYSYTEKTIFPFPFKISHSIWKEIEYEFSQCTTIRRTAPRDCSVSRHHGAQLRAPIWRPTNFKTLLQVNEVPISSHI